MMSSEVHLKEYDILGYKVRLCSSDQLAEGESAVALLKKELEGIDYGGKHNEAKFTKFFQSYFLPTLYGYEKQRAHLASLVMSKQIKREDALAALEKPLQPN